MLKINDKVKINVSELDTEGLTPETNTTGKDYYSYIFKNEDIEFTITGIDNTCPNAPYQLNDEYLSETSFMEKELVLVNL